MQQMFSLVALLSLVLFLILQFLVYLRVMTMLASSSNDVAYVDYSLLLLNVITVAIASAYVAPAYKELSINICKKVIQLSVKWWRFTSTAILRCIGVADDGQATDAVEQSLEHAQFEGVIHSTAGISLDA